MADGPLVPSSIEVAATWTDTWAAIGAAVIDGFDPTASFDLLPGIQLIEHARRIGASGVLILAVPVLDEVIRLRGAEVGASAVIHRSEIPRYLADPSPVSTAPDPSLLRTIGLRASSRPNAGVRWVQKQGLERPFTGSWRLDPSIVSRRESITIRQKLTELIGIDVVRGGTRHLDQRAVPSWRQIRRVIDAARGAQPAQPAH